MLYLAKPKLSLFHIKCVSFFFFPLLHSFFVFSEIKYHFLLEAILFCPYFQCSVAQQVYILMVFRWCCFLKNPYIKKVAKGYKTIILNPALAASSVSPKSRCWFIITVRFHLKVMICFVIFIIILFSKSIHIIKRRPKSLLLFWIIKNITKICSFFHPKLMLLHHLQVQLNAKLFWD